MTFSFLLVEKEGLGCPSSPQLPPPDPAVELLHLLYESKLSNTYQAPGVKGTQESHNAVRSIAPDEGRRIRGALTSFRTQARSRVDSAPNTY